ncbi:hypothetical protein [Marinomonas sp. 2405UD68-3]|uniref:hypothetical protein n=1 Tax=Marinomonas sp. 2405UD68-3 TaxID=3391835 RepID=UPI0039C9C647
MPKPHNLKNNIKHRSIREDQHNPTMPTTNATLWARGLTTKQVADLFRILRPLDANSRP